MIANQTLVADDGYEVALFPLEYLYMTQDEGGDFSHAGTYNIDFVGYNGTAVVTQCPIYAPCTMKLVFTNFTPSGGNMCVFESVDKVHLANADLDYLTISFAHDLHPPITTIGQVVNQGDLCYHTGEYGYVTGDHVHSCCGQGQFAGLTERQSGNWDLTNRIHYWDAVFVNDTGIVQGYGHDWKDWTQPPTPPSQTRKRKFPFVVAKHHWWRTKNLYR